MLYPFEATGEGTLSVQKRDILFAVSERQSSAAAAAAVVPPDPEGWTFLMREDGSARGYVPDTFVIFLAPLELAVEDKVK